MTDIQNPLALLYAALAKAQGAYELVTKNRTATEADHETGEINTWQYADLEEVLSAVRPALAANGLAFFQRTARVTGSNGLDLLSEIVHKDGGLISSCVPIASPDAFNDPKQYGAMQTLLRRYQAEAILGITSYFEGEGDSLPVVAAAQPVKQPQVTTKHEPFLFYSQAKFDAQVDDWRAAVGNGITTPQKIIATIESKAPLSDEQRNTIKAMQKYD